MKRFATLRASKPKLYILGLTDGDRTMTCLNIYSQSPIPEVLRPAMSNFLGKDLTVM